MTQEKGQGKASEEQGNEKGLYLYAVIMQEGKGENQIENIKGLGDRPLRLVPYENLAAVVSDATGTARSANRENLLRHAAVLGEILDQQQLLPFRFGLIAADEKEITDNLLKPHHNDFSEKLSKLNGKEELGLKVYWNEKAVLNDLVNNDEQIKKLRDALVAKGNATDPSIYQQKVDLGRMIEQAVTQKRDQLKEEVMQTLTPLSEEQKENKLLSDNMVLNAAFLVPEGKEQEFGQKLKELDKKHHDFLTFKYIPEAPPYNFVQINIETGATR